MRIIALAKYVATAGLGMAVVALLAACNRSAQAPPPASEKNIVVLTAANFQAEVLESPQPVLVDFWATWCGPCRVVAPTIAALADEFHGTAKVGKVDVDAQPELAQKYGVENIPTLIVFKNGKVVEQLVGVRSQTELAAMLRKHSAAPAAAAPQT